MPQVATDRFGTVEYSQESVIEFPQGLPGFESEHQFLLMEQPQTQPIVFLQSLMRRELSFLALPVTAIDPDYGLQLSTDDLAVIGLTAEQTIPLQLALLAIICVDEGMPPTANLLGPVAINRDNRRAIQAIRDDSRYSATHPLFSPVDQTETVCS
jgi:flagellar assembly factor FliW